MISIVSVETPDHIQKWNHAASQLGRSVMDFYEWSKVVQEAYGIKSHMLMAEEKAAPVAFLALFEIRHPIFGHYLVTAPFGTDGGMISKSDAAIEPLSKAAASLADSLNVDYLLIRTRSTKLPGYVLESRYQTALLDLRQGEDHIWNKEIDPTTRNHIRKGMKQNFELRQGADQLPVFFDVFHQHMRDLGSPAHSYSFYESILRHFPNHTDIYVLRDGARAIAAALTFSINGIVSNLHTVALKSYNPRCPNYLIYWNMIQKAVASGAHTFDMGRSVEGGKNMAFKKQWGAKPVTLSYNYYLRRGTEVPFLDPRNAKYRLAIEAWRMTPVFLTKRIGPLLISGLV